MKTVTIYTDGGHCFASPKDAASAPGFAGTAEDGAAGAAGWEAA